MANDVSIFCHWSFPRNCPAHLKSLSVKKERVRTTSSTASRTQVLEDLMWTSVFRSAGASDLCAGETIKIRMTSQWFTTRYGIAEKLKVSEAISHSFSLTFFFRMCFRSRTRSLRQSTRRLCAKWCHSRVISCRQPRPCSHQNVRFRIRKNRSPVKRLP